MAAPTKPWGFAWRSHTLFIVATVGASLFADLFLYALVLPVLPFALRDRVGIPQSEVQSYTSFLLALYAIVSCIVSPIAGLIADRTESRRGPFLLGLIALAIATVGLFLGTSIPVLAIARSFQGASGSVVWTIGLALCMDTVGPQNLGKTLGTINSFINLGELVAPTLGGFLYAKVGHLGVLAVAVVVLVFDLVMRLLLIEKKIAARYEPDPPEQEEESLPAESSSSSATVENSEADEATSLLPKKDATPNEDAKDDQPSPYLIPADVKPIYKKLPVLYPLVYSPSLKLALMMNFVQAILIASIEATVPIHAHELFGSGSLQSGLLFIPLVVVHLILGPLFGWIMDKRGVKLMAVAGYAWLIPAFLLLRLPHAALEPGPDQTKQIALFATLLGVAGVGTTAVGPVGIVEAGAMVEKFHSANPGFFGDQGPYASLYGLSSMIFCAGLSVGSLVAGALKDAIGYGNMNATVSAVSAVSGALCLVWLGGRPLWLGGKENQIR